MSIVVISYSLTGNNESLAKSIAKEYVAEHITVNESKKRTMGTIVFDMLFNRIPKIQTMQDGLGKHDLTMFVAPVWMGMVASPLRQYLRQQKANGGRYAFVSISGGADGPNPKLADELKKRTGYEPAALIDLHIADLLASGSKLTRDDTSTYKITGNDIDRLMDSVKKTLDKIT